MIKLSIIILSYNTKDLLKECLESIYKHLPKDFFEVIVLDSASSDGSPEMTKKEFPKVNIIVSDVNLGFGKGINQAAKEAKGEYLLFLNSDAQLQDSSVAEMLSFAKKDEKIGVVGGILANEDGGMQRSYGKFYGLSQVVKMLVWGDKGEMGNEKVDWVSGGFMLVRKSLFEKLHGFDEHFFMYMEDMELCYRMKKLGYQVYVYPQARVLHFGQGSSNRSFAIQHIYKGLLYFYKKHKSPLEYCILKLLLTTKAVILVLLGGLTNNGYLKSTYRKVLQ